MDASRHFILTAGRSGSNHLTNSLNKHPRIVNYGEVLGEWTLPYKLHQVLLRAGVTWSGFLDALYDSSFLFYSGQVASAISHLRQKKPINFKRRSHTRSIGVKDFAFLLCRRELNSYLANRKDIRVIHLRRRNLLDRYLSLLRMDQTGIVKTDRDGSLARKITVDIDDMMQSLDALALEGEQELELVKLIEPNRLYSIQYEDYFSSHKRTQEILAEVLEFLDLPPMSLLSDQRKISPDRLEDSLENYAEVCKALKGGIFAEYLHD